MNTALKSLAWSAVALLMLLSVATPLSGITIFLLMTPMVVLYTMLRPVSFAVHIAGIAVLAFLILGSSGALALTFGFFFLVPSIVMGHLYKKRVAAKTVVTVGFIILLAQLVTELTLFSIQYDIDFTAQLASFLDERIQELQASNMLTGDWTGTAQAFGEAVVRLLPMLLMLCSFLLAIITHGISRRVLAWSGIVVPALTPMRSWMLPKSTVLLYVIVWIIQFTMPANSSNFWAVASDNAVPVLDFLFRIQALAFFFYLAHQKKWSNVVPVLIAIPLFLIQPLYLIGLLDTAFPLRRYFDKK
ncbi:YybS family protein [Cohnella ginsengisoli]|uniref:YybS family protein n=1 Tax=Cohnella ginsengisoli TaxID=425004 RepID=A0A9X4QR32_9BACL|nr:DUF2232 domain-containing protein [Cohnella ginsengisoli]MDG0795231.1 YybS family protein [Cohnella ginsengisoli]